MNAAVRLAISAFILTAIGFAQVAFDVHQNGKQQWPAEEAQKIYVSACAVVQREFGNHQTVRPRFILILGGDKNGVALDKREIRLSKWDPYLFAQGVVMLGFDDLMTLDQRLAMSKRALTLADSAVAVERFRKRLAGFGKRNGTLVANQRGFSR